MRGGASGSRSGFASDEMRQTWSEKRSKHQFAPAEDSDTNTSISSSSSSGSGSYIKMKSMHGKARSAYYSETKIDELEQLEDKARQQLLWRIGLYIIGALLFLILTAAFLFAALYPRHELNNSNANFNNEIDAEFAAVNHTLTHRLQRGYFPTCHWDVVIAAQRNSRFRTMMFTLYCVRWWGVQSDSGPLATAFAYLPPEILFVIASFLPFEHPSQLKSLQLWNDEKLEQRQRSGLFVMSYHSPTT